MAGKKRKLPRREMAKRFGLSTGLEKYFESNGMVAAPTTVSRRMSRVFASRELLGKRRVTQPHRGIFRGWAQAMGAAMFTPNDL